MSLTVAVSGIHAGENPMPGYGVCRSLRRAFPEIELIGLVYDVLESGIYAEDGPDAVYEIPYPSAGSEALLARFDYISSRHHIDMLIPTLDAELLPLLNLQGEFLKRGIQMLLPELASFHARQKTALPELAKRCKFHTPRSLPVTDVPGLLRAAHELVYPVFVKGPFYEAYKEATPASATARFHSLAAKWGLPIIVQQAIKGSEFNVIAVGDGTGGVCGFCAVRKTILSDKGKGYGAIVIRDEHLNEIALRIIRELKWRGPLELEFLQDEKSEQYYLIEINPRFPAWVDFPSTFGHNLPALVVDILRGQPRQLPPYPVGKFFLRHCVDLTCDVAQMGQLSTTGELELREHQHG